MRALIQRVASASVVVDNLPIGEIDRGILLLLGVQKHDNEKAAEKLLSKVLAYRIFPDNNGHMNLSLSDIDGELLIVSQFTIAANTKKGLRPSFSSAAPPEKAKALYKYVVDVANESCRHVATGRFGADMQVSLVNDGPVTFLLEV